MLDQKGAKSERVRDFPFLEGIGEHAIADVKGGGAAESELEAHELPKKLI